jgi:hypothetical protein
MLKWKRVFALLLICAFALAGCAGQNAATDTSSAGLSPASTIEVVVSSALSPSAAPTPTPEALPDIGALTAQYHVATGVTLTWKPFTTGLTCALERRDDDATGFSNETTQESGDSLFKTISVVDSEAGTFTDSEPGPGGAQPVYRLCASDGQRAAHSQEAQCFVPFEFGNTGGNLQNGGLVCEKSGAVYRLGVQSDEIGIYAIDAAGSAALLVKGIASQINVAEGYLYYISQATGKLYRVPLTGGEPALVCSEKMLFVLAVGSRVFGTLDRSGALVVMNADGSGRETLDRGGCFDLGADGQTLYYTNTVAGQFVMRDLVTGETHQMPLAGRSFAQLLNGRVYYQDESNGKRLTSCLPDGSDLLVLMDQAVTGVNATERGVYFISRVNGDTPYWVALDGSDMRQLASVRGDYINTMGGDVMLIDTDGKFYQVGDDGTVTRLYG